MVLQIMLLKIAVNGIESKIKWEASGSHGVFPHMYAPFSAMGFLVLSVSSSR